MIEGLIIMGVAALLALACPALRHADRRDASVAAPEAPPGLGAALRGAFSEALTDAPDPCSCELLGQLCDHDDLARGTEAVERIYREAAARQR